MIHNTHATEMEDVDVIVDVTAENVHMSLELTYGECNDLAVELTKQIPDDWRETALENGDAPDDRTNFDIAAVDMCPGCGVSPAAVIQAPDSESWECYNCGE